MARGHVPRDAEAQGFGEAPVGPEAEDQPASRKSWRSSGRRAKKVPGVHIPRQGAGTAVILGGPNAGKSQLLASLTRATPEVAPYPFTTRTAQPGMMPWEDVMVQLIDTPPITADYLEPYMQGMIRGADLALLLVDLGADEGIEQCQEVLDQARATRRRGSAKTTCLDEEDIGLSYTRTFLVPNKIDLRRRGGAAGDAARGIARWTLRST